MVHRNTEIIDTIAFGLIGIAVVAVGFGSLGAAVSVPASPPPAAPVEAAVFDVDLMPLPVVNPITVPAEAAEAAPAEVVEPPPAGAAVATAPTIAETPAAPRAERPAPKPRAKPADRVARRKPASKRGKGKRKGKGKKRCTEAPDPLIVATSADRFTVDRAVIQRYTRNWSRLNELGWSKRHKDSNGKADGMQIGGIRCGSDPFDAGFRNGDVIHAVNGRAVKSIPQALLVYTAIHNDKIFEVDITRRGVRKTLRFRLTS